jgi:TolB-like protein
VPAVLALLAVLLLAGCASNPAARRATLITDADRAARAAVAGENALDPSKIPARAFAVLPFAVADRDTLLRPLGFGLADLLMNDLAKSPQLQLVERMRTSAILRELDLVDAGVVDPRQGPRVGRLVGARRLLLGSASQPSPGTVRIDARVVDVIAGTVQELVSAEAPIDRVIDAEKALALLLFERLGITLTPAQRARVEQRQTTQLAALVAYGRGIEAETRGDAAGATAAFEEASRLDAAFAAARSQVASGGAASAQRASSVQRVLDLTAQAVNAPVATRVPEAVDAPLASGSVLQLVFTIRVTP